MNDNVILSLEGLSAGYGGSNTISNINLSLTAGEALCVVGQSGCGKSTLLRLIDICRLVSSKHTREHVRACLPSSCGYILDELLHAHFEDHDKDLYYGQIVGSIIENGRADRFIVRLCELIKHLAVDKLHIVGDLFDRGPRPDRILDSLMAHHQVDIQWGNHDVVWMGAAAGSPICICTVLKLSLIHI